ncbi:hypothetical protein WN51_12187 [Melipona quadrifasciata]|uniref:Uncharacterized protein n=1 Tax=Melipona quadrifasciata TaxID=166423 RepID=A0A0M9A3W9_9HYME|nr:hypothetical protein WN51_12187 [Melipona quadrifasciata]
MKVLIRIYMRRRGQTDFYSNGVTQFYTQIIQWSHTDSTNEEIDGRVYLEIDVNDVEYSRTSEERPREMSTRVIKLVAAVKPKQDEWPMCGQWRGQETSVLLLTVGDILFSGQNHGVRMHVSS